jgi:hypothetical protein
VTHVTPNPRAQRVRAARQAVRLSAYDLAALVGWRPWRVYWTERGLRPDYSEEEEAFLLEAIRRCGMERLRATGLAVGRRTATRSARRLRGKKGGN